MWEGIGIASFLLISFWYTRIQAVKAGVQALVVNRVGDMMLSVGLFAMFFLFGNLDYGTVFPLSPYINEISITIIGLLLFIGATAKSAQIPLHIWLPASMEGKLKTILIGFNNRSHHHSHYRQAAARVVLVVLLR
jgi:NADH-ubiquinone oxidoreductase chain 5